MGRRRAGDLINFQINYLTYLSSPIPLEDKFYLLDQHIGYSKENINHYIYDPFVISIKIVQIIKFISCFLLLRIDYMTVFYTLNQNFFPDDLKKNFWVTTFSSMVLVYYFQRIILRVTFFSASKRNFSKQLTEQFLDDGMHFELSPMYNAILIKEMMLCYDLLVNNNDFGDVLSHLFKDTIERAMSFYDFISVDGYYPCLNDSYFLSRS